MSAWLQSAFPEFIGGIMAIVCAIIGAKMASRSTERQAQRRDLLDAYAAVFADYYACIANDSEPAVVALITSIERACLICSPTSESLMRQLVPMLLADKRDYTAIGKTMTVLRGEAKKDARKANRKHHRSEDE